MWWEANILSKYQLHSSYCFGVNEFEDKIMLLTEELQLTQSQCNRDNKKCLFRKLFDDKIRINNLVKKRALNTWKTSLT